jgi:hypothetical protein
MGHPTWVGHPKSKSRSAGVFPEERLLFKVSKFGEMDCKFPEFILREWPRLQAGSQRFAIESDSWGAKGLAGPS